MISREERKKLAAQARELLRQRGLKESDRLEAWLQRGRSALAVKEYDDARSCFVRVMQDQVASPDERAIATVLLATVDISRKRLEPATKLTKVAMAISGASSEVAACAIEVGASLHAYAGDTQLAISELEQIKALPEVGAETVDNAAYWQNELESFMHVSDRGGTGHDTGVEKGARWKRVGHQWHMQISNRLSDKSWLDSLLTHQRSLVVEESPAQQAKGLKLDRSEQIVARLPPEAKAGGTVAIELPQQLLTPKGGKPATEELTVTDLIAALAGATEAKIQEIALGIAPEIARSLATTFLSAARRQHWKRVLNLDLRHLAGDEAVSRVNQWLEQNAGTYAEVSTEVKDSVIDCLREIRDELAVDFVSSSSMKSGQVCLVTLKNDFDRHGKRRFRYVDQYGRAKRSQGLPDIRVRPVKKTEPSP